MTHAADSAVMSIESWKCSFPLAPFRIGRTTIASREYNVVRVTTAAGVQGAAFGIAKSVPVDLAVTETIAPHYLGREVTDPAAAYHAASLAILPNYVEGIVGRAISLVDIAIWDAYGQHAGSPVWKLLGARRQSAPVLLVEGYPIDAESDEAFVERLGARAQAGYSLLKVAYTAHDVVRLTRRLHLLCEALPAGVQVVVDGLYCWRDLEAARAVISSWQDLELAWVEDPVLADDFTALTRLRTMWHGLIGIGDEVTRQATLYEGVKRGAYDVLRLDAMTAGGLTNFGELARAAESHGVLVSTHGYPEVHRHAAFGATAAGPLEMVPVDSRWDAFYRFVEPARVTVEPVTGMQTITAEDEPGLGLRIDWQAVEAAAVRRSACGGTPG